MNSGNNFEASLAALEKIVRDLENGDLPLDESLKLFEQGIGLYRQCQERLNQAERRIEVLLRDSEGNPIVESLTDKNLSKAEPEPEPKVKRRYVFSDDDEEQDESVF